MEGFENCGVREDDSVVCLSISCRTNPCNGCSNEGFSKFSDSDMFWSSSTRSDGTYDAWSVYFDGDYVDNGYVDTSNKTSYYLYVRCVR